MPIPYSVPLEVAPRSLAVADSVVVAAAALPSAEVVLAAPRLGVGPMPRARALLVTIVVGAAAVAGAVGATGAVDVRGVVGAAAAGLPLLGPRTRPIGQMPRRLGR